MDYNKIYCIDNIKGMSQLGADTVDLTVTSPPYDKIRNYKGFTWDFEEVAKELFRVTKQGGVVVWVVGDVTINGSESGTSFKQALYFKEIGFNLHDTMIYKKHSMHPPNVRYWQIFEYMFIFSKGKIKTFNPLMQLKKESTLNRHKYKVSYRPRKKNGFFVDEDALATQRGLNANSKNERIMDNIWEYKLNKGLNDAISYSHPATFPEKLVEDHILSWSNEGDLVLDPFMGSGTTAKMAKLNNRNYIGFEISQEYVDIAEKRLEQTAEV